MTESMSAYMHALLPERHPVLARLEQESREEGIPSIVPEAGRVLAWLVQTRQPRRILEIGTAIGYSGISMALACDNSELISLELDEQRAARARHNLAEAGLSDRSQVVIGDAACTLDTLVEPFDFVFIDAAKGQYPVFLEKALPKCTEGALIVTDNVLFRGYPSLPESEVPKKYRSLVRKLKGYNEYLMNHPQMNTMMLTVGDGLAVSTIYHSR
ncbi:O-methyltransferase [Marinicrinis sediminis]|uniref:tRNA 5-hydroxyuridine methyltransferase n=1 Tax=Marinicrinis sediminis TaxID=1652465 RepID=A0ABW5R6N3_9BACL